MVGASCSRGKGVRDLRLEDEDKATAKGEFVGALCVCTLSIFCNV